MSDLQDGWTTLLCSDVIRDGMGLELRSPAGDHMAEIFRCDVTKTVIITTFNNDIPLSIFESYYAEAWHRLDPFEDGTSFAAAGLQRSHHDPTPGNL